MSTLEPRTDRPALSRDLTEFHGELPIAPHKHSEVFGGHGTGDAPAGTLRIIQITPE